MTASDSGSGLAGAPTCTVDGDPATVSGSGSPWSVSVTGEGTHPVSCSVSDNATNSNTAADTVYIDTVNPTITVSHTANGDNGWNTTAPVSVSVAVSDATSGIAGAPTCTVGGNPATVTGSSSPYSVSVTGEGSHTVSCSVRQRRAQQLRQRHREDRHCQPERHDHDQQRRDLHQVTSVTLNLNATDATSMIVSYRVANGSGCASASFVTPFAAVSPYSADPSHTLPTGDGSKTVCAQYKDEAGNVSSTATDSITLDQTNPTSRSRHTDHGSNGWNTTDPVSVSVAASDATSGLAGAPTCTAAATRRP